MGDRMVAALYVDARRGPYSSLDSVDVWGIERDAKLYDGAAPVVAHPPCGPWGRLWHLCTKQDPECATIAAAQVRRCGGVLEHPAHSKLWTAAGLPRPGELVSPGEFSIRVDQWVWGHQSVKPTWLFVSGCQPEDVPRTAVATLTRWPPCRSPNAT